MKLDRDVRKMSFSERGREIVRLRREIRRWARLKGKQCCQPEDQRLAQAIGLKPIGRVELSDRALERNFAGYIARRLRSGEIGA